MEQYSLGPRRTIKPHVAVLCPIITALLTVYNTVEVALEIRYITFRLAHDMQTCVEWYRCFFCLVVISRCVLYAPLLSFAQFEVIFSSLSLSLSLRQRHCRLFIPFLLSFWWRPMAYLATERVNYGANSRLDYIEIPLSCIPAVSSSRCICNQSRMTYRFIDTKKAQGYYKEQTKGERERDREDSQRKEP